MTGMERSEIRWGTTQIPYLIRRSARRGTVSVAVEPSGRVVLTAPAATTVERLDRVVRQKARWIVEHTRRSGDLPSPADREFISGETVLYLGRSYRLRVVEGQRTAPARLHGKWLVVTIPHRLNATDRAAAVRKHLIAWYRLHADLQLRNRATRWGKAMHLLPQAVLIRDPQSRWGSCNDAGSLRLNWRIIQAPSALIDYVVVHELLHLRDRQHSVQFWASHGRTIPNYDELRARLRTLGPALVW